MEDGLFLANLASWRSNLPETKKALRYRKAFEEIGAGDEIRTHDIHLGKVALYH
jgi:hypothetical protein